MKKLRLLQLVTGVHFVHHFVYSYGFKLPFFEIGYFENFGWQKTNRPKLRGVDGKNINKPYHNCTLTGVY